MGWPYPCRGWVGNEIARYDYRDARGHVAYQVVRFEPKDFRLYDPNKKAWNCKGIERIPYRLPELLEGIKAGQHIFIVEGEKDVETLYRLGLVATCNPGGVGSKGLWKSFAGYFTEGTKVFLLPDADEPGQRLMNEIGQRLSAQRVAVTLLDLGYPITSSHGKDVTDWLAEGHTGDELMALSKDGTTWQAAPAGALKTAAKHEKQADRLLAHTADLELFHDGDTLLSVRVNDPVRHLN